MAAKTDAVEDVVVTELACAVQLCVHVKRNAKASESPLLAKHLFIHYCYMNITDVAPAYTLNKHLKV